MASRGLHNSATSRVGILLPGWSTYSGRVVGNQEVIQVGPISNDKSASVYWRFSGEGTASHMPSPDWCHNDVGLATARVNCSVFSPTVLGPKEAEMRQRTEWCCIDGLSWQPLSEKWNFVVSSYAAGFLPCLNRPIQKMF